MNANKAKELTTAARVVDMTSIYRKIEAAAKSGHDIIQIKVGEWKTTNSVDNIIADLRKNGYTVKRENGYDQRDGDGWDYLNVSW